MVLQVRGMPAQKQHQAIINRTEQVQHITEVQVVEVLREVTEHPLLQQNQAIATVLLREAAAATEAVEVAAEVVVRHTPEVPEVPEVLVAQVEVHDQVHHHQVEDNKRMPLSFKY